MPKPPYFLGQPHIRIDVAGTVVTSSLTNAAVDDLRENEIRTNEVLANSN
ncbi:MAG TPA: hypothetical protein VM144_00280 [Aestuariivirga sp.]|nr:hypothetical protein [Aestuariivirga sp.]